MEIWHRGHLDPQREALLETYDVQYIPLYSTVEPSRVEYLLIDIAESNPGWSQIAPLMKHKTFVWTEFTQEEIQRAEWLVGVATHSVGYPMRKEPWSEAYYDAGCTVCGVGWRQKAPFAIQREPPLKKNAFASFSGAFELFCTPQVLDTLRTKGIRGYDVWPVLLHGTGEPSQMLSQLVVHTLARPCLAEELADGDRFRKQVCVACANTWYSYYNQGMMPLHREALRERVDLQFTQEWFGNGRTARRELLVSQRVARLVAENNWKGLSLAPVRLV